MKICPNCNESNGDNNAKCFKCGAELPMTKKDTASNKSSTRIQLPSATPVVRRNSEKISNLAAVVVIMGIIIGVITGLLYRTSATSDLMRSFNWFLFIGAVVGAVCLAIILMALSYVAKAIEEK